VESIEDHQKLMQAPKLFFEGTEVFEGSDHMIKSIKK